MEPGGSQGGSVLLIRLLLGRRLGPLITLAGADVKNIYYRRHTKLENLKSTIQISQPLLVELRKARNRVTPCVS
jgi:hypothetical protein